MRTFADYGGGVGVDAAINTSAIESAWSDLASGGEASSVELRGLAVPQLGTGDYFVGLDAPGHTSARIDLSGLRSADGDAALLVTDRRTASAKQTLPAAVAPAMAIETAHRATSGPNRTRGQLVPLSFTGNSEVPAVDLLGMSYDTAALTTRFAMPYSPISGARMGTISASSRIILAQRPIVAVDSAGNGTAAALKRVEISAGGVASGTFNTSNHWKLEIYLNVTSTLTLYLSRDTASLGTAGYPSKIFGDATTGYLMDFWDGLGSLHAFKGTYVSAQLTKVGSPADLTDCQVTLYFALSE